MEVQREVGLNVFNNQEEIQFYQVLLLTPTKDATEDNNSQDFRCKMCIIDLNYFNMLNYVHSNFQHQFQSLTVNTDP